MAAPLSIRRRYAHSGPFIKTNHVFGDDFSWVPTTYRVDYSSRHIHDHISMPKTALPCPSTQSSQHARLKTVSEDEWLNDTTPRLPAMDKNLMRNANSQKKHKLNVNFGNDPPEHLTAYAEFAQNFGKHKNAGGMMCKPPEPAEIFPEPSGGRGVWRASVGGSHDLPGIADKVHEKRLHDLHIVKDTHESDSVAHTLRQAPPARMMSQSMVVYRPPRARICHSVAPAARMDSIWKSIGGAARKVCDCTETRQNYAWPHSWPTKRCQMNKTR